MCLLLQLCHMLVLLVSILILLVLYESLGEFIGSARAIRLLLCYSRTWLVLRALGDHVLYVGRSGQSPAHVVPEYVREEGAFIHHPLGGRNSKHRGRLFFVIDPIRDFGHLWPCLLLGLDGISIG